jgi:hypothetical protein
MPLWTRRPDPRGDRDAPPLLTTASHERALVRMALLGGMP